MIEIKKYPEPAGLKALREKAELKGLSPEKAYQKLKDPLKSTVRDSLVSEQGQLCAYCMCRIPRPDVGADAAPIIIEHVVPRNPEDGRDVGQGLDYRNLLVVCHGNRGKKGNRRFIDLTCDAHRGNIEFRKVHPCKKDTIASVTYNIEGKIDAADEDVRFDLVDTLNLNCLSAPLIGERKEALNALIAELGEVPEEEMLLYCRSRLAEFENESNPKTPYAGILIWYLTTMVQALMSK